MTSRVLCLSDDAAFASRISAPLEYSYPEVSVLSVDDVAEGVEVVRTEHVDAVVTDAATIAAAPALLEAVRSRRPELSLLVLSTYETGGEHRTAVAEVVDFLDGVGSADDGALADWVANSVVDDGDAPVPGAASQLDTVVAGIKRELVDATRPGDVESAVCERLVLADQYAFAWIGEFDRGEGQVVPWGTAAADGDWPRSRTFPAGDDVDGVVAEVLRTRRPTVVDDVEGYGPPVPWREASLERDCESLVFVPLQTEEELFGVLGVYSTDPEGVDVPEQEALVEVADTTARVLEGMAIRGRIDQQERILRRYERLVETVGDGMYALDAEGHFMTVNDALCAMTGYAREGLLGEHIDTILDADAARSWSEAVESLQGTAGESRSLELTVETKHCDTFPCENKVGLLPSDEDGVPRGTVGVLRDITERKERERALHRQNERLDAFASIVSHDLRNPLSVAQGYLEHVAESTADQESVARVEESLDRMNELIDDVLALARGGETVTDTSPVHLSTAVRSAWSNVDTRGASLDVSADVKIEAADSRLLRLFENLFRNAIEHGGEDVTVTVGVLETTDPDTVGLYVEDNGPGIPPDVRDHVFESQFTTSERGNGIGLWVVSEVADAHDWTATACVGSEGGARFEFAQIERSS
ncbi:putative signal-transducing histidine kinase / response regulator [Salinarchaeum sp. Harcht-Bsk1]|uniref:hybrid sensor histidine kinase/response regulator n=1 Tax=Salinarchaeum sp. Harcht-Bsk1 TaxID=1333523 RepID=UPI00034228A8|nr:PAS domain S-box protein [Salinarchaeum sp. Harcht-Bsk1]AGN02843.1 putative signal-transducing histidine kinase / response regulator [Salinarchaeum sp. Harcht-Bsk1]